MKFPHLLNKKKISTDELVADIASYDTFALKEYFKSDISLVRFETTFCAHFKTRRVIDRPSTQLILS